MSFLENLGWDSFFEHALQNLPEHSTLLPARICGHERGCYHVFLATGQEVSAFLLKSKRQQIERHFGLPTVGDWVLLQKEDALDSYRISALLARKTVISRPTPGQPQKKQNLAANVDLAFVVMSLNEDFNLKRLDRYLTLILGSHVTPIVVLSKADLCSDPEAKVNQIRQNYSDVKIVVISREQSQGISELTSLLRPGNTIVLLGSSGVGKSTLANILLGHSLQATKEIRSSDGRGKHTTSGRHLILLANKSTLIDSPGIRELQMNAQSQNLEEAFKDVMALAQDCKFTNCLHRTEPHCSVKKAIKEGSLSQERFDHFEKLQAEVKKQQNTHRNR